MARAVVHGATGNIGQRIVAEALARGHDVVAKVRTPSKVTQTSNRLSVVTTDPTDPAEVTAAVRGADAVIASLDVRWTYLSPAELVEPGARQPGGHRLGDDDLVQDDAGVTRIPWPLEARRILSPFRSR